MHDWNRFFRPVSRNLSNSVYRIFEPEWKPRILEWFASEEVTPAEKEAFLYALTHFEDACGDFFRYRAYFLAAEAIAHFRDSVQADAIIDQLLLWSYAYFRQDKRDWKTYPTALTKAARRVLEQTDRPRVIARFEKLLCTTDSRSILRIAAEQLGKFDPGNQCAIAALAFLIQKEQSTGRLLAIVRSLIKIAPNHPAIIPVLLRVIETPIDRQHFRGYGRLRSAYCYLGEVAVGDARTIALLLNQLSHWQTQDVLVFDIVITLKTIAVGNPAAIDVLMQVIQTILAPDRSPADWEGVPLYWILETLRVIAAGHWEVIPILTQLLSEQEHPESQSLLASTIIWLQPGHSLANLILTQLLDTYLPQVCGRYEVDSIVERSAVGLLRSTVAHSAIVSPSANSRVYDALVHLASIQLRRCEPDPPREMVKLKEIDPLHQIEQEILLRLVETAESGSRVWSAIDRLTQLNTRNDQAIAAVKSLVQITHNVANLIAAIEFLQAVAPTELFILETIAAKLTQILQDAQEDYDRRDAAYCLAKLTPNHPIALSVLTELWECKGQKDAILTLIRLNSCDENVVNVLVAFLQTQALSEYDCLQFILYFQKLKSVELITQIIQRLKPYLELQPKHPTKINQLESQSTSAQLLYAETGFTAGDRANLCHEIIWNYAQNMTYPDFCKIWLAF